MPHPHTTREATKALQGYIAECTAQAKLVDDLITRLGEEIAKADNLERITLYTAMYRLGLKGLPAPNLGKAAVAKTAEACRILNEGGVPLPSFAVNSAADRLKFLIEQIPDYRPGLDL